MSHRINDIAAFLAVCKGAPLCLLSTGSRVRVPPGSLKFLIIPEQLPDGSESITVSEAVERFLKDVEARELRIGSIKKYRVLLAALGVIFFPVRPTPFRRSGVCFVYFMLMVDIDDLVSGSE